MSIPLLDGIVLTDFLSLIMGHEQCVPVPHYIADKLNIADHDEVYIHIEQRDGKHFVWRVAEWKSTYAKWQRDKTLSHLNRTASCRATEVYAAVARAIASKTGLTTEQAYPVAEAAVRARNPEAIRKLTGINIAELLKADGELQAFKQAHKIK